MTESVRATFHHSRYRKAVHIHQFAEIVFVLEGKLRVTANGKRIIAKAGDLIIVPPYQSHGFYTEDGNEVKLWMFLFSTNLLSDISIGNELILRTRDLYVEAEHLVVSNLEIFDSGLLALTLGYLLLPLISVFNDRTKLIDSFVVTVTDYTALANREGRILLDRSVDK